MKSQNPLIDTLNRYLDKDLSLNRSLLRSRKTNGTNDSRRGLNRTSGATMSLTSSDVSYLAVNNSRPIVLAANKQVIELEKSGGLGYNPLNIKTEIKPETNIPLCCEQEDIGMIKSSIHPRVPILERVGPNEAIVVVDKGGFKYPYVRPPKFEIVSVPKHLNEAGPNLDKKVKSDFDIKLYFDFQS